MNNPYHPNRKIRHADVMVKAGFEIDQRWYKLPKPPNECSVSKLIYWKHREFKDIYITLFDYQQISLENLVKKIREQLIYHFNKNAKINYE